MKVGDTFPVSVQGITIAKATVTHVDVDRVTLEVPGTRAVVGVRTSLVDETPVNEGAKDQIIVTDNPVPSTPAVDTPAPQSAVATGAVSETVVTEGPAPSAAEANLREGATPDAPVEPKHTEVEPKEETTSTEAPKPETNNE